jgi:hypothetical protein
MAAVLQSIGRAKLPSASWSDGVLTAPGFRMAVNEVVIRPTRRDEPAYRKRACDPENYLPEKRY